MMRRGFAVVPALLLMVLLLAAGCGQATEGEKEVTLRTTGFFGGADPSAPYYEELIKSFEDANPHIKINDESATSDEVWKAKVLTDFSADNEPDVLLFFTGADVKQLIEDGKVVSIEEIQKDYPDYAKSITPAAMSFMTEFDGKEYAVPIRGFYEGLFCNKDLFDEHDIALPGSWENLLAAISAFQEKGIVPIAASFADVPHYWIEHVVLAAGGVEDHSVNPVGSYPESWVKGLEQLKVLYDLGAFNKDLNSTKNDLIGNLFVTKKAAMVLDGSWFMGAVEDKENTVILPFPAMPGSPKDPSDIIAGFSGGFYISRKAYDDPEKREAAVKFVMHMTTPEAIALMCKDAGGAPAAKIPVDPDLNPLQAAGFEMAGAARAADMPIDSRMDKDAWNYLVSKIPALVEGQITAKQLLDEVAAMNQ